eukprot:08783.XXX_379211_379739_1 [CDS] Oithona nana genome sequencing.
MLKTKFLEFVKSIAFGIKQAGKKPEDTSKDELNEEEYVSVGSIDETSEAPAPKEGPKPSKIPVVLFYLSVVFTMIGSIICIRLLFMVQDTKCEKNKVLIIGCGMISVGIYLIVITNSIMNREKSGIMRYLAGKVEELHQDENSRSKRNLRNAQLI